MKRLKSSLSLVLTVLFIFSALPFSASAEEIGSGACGENLTWSLDGDGVLTISGTGDMEDYGYFDTPWYDDKYSITSVIIEEGVTRIGDRAFYRCTKMENITFADSVASIGYSAFEECLGLDAVTIGQGVKTIEEFAFSSCLWLDEVTIPEGVTTIGNDAFHWCSQLKGITIPDSVTSIGDTAFCQCTSLADLKIGNGVTSIGYGAFAGCNSLTDVIIPGNVTKIGDSAFSDCYSLTDLTISEGVLKIGAGAFSGCDGLTSVTIPASVETIKDRVFEECINLSEIKVSAESKSLCDIDGVLYSADKTAVYQYPQAKSGDKYIIPQGVKTIRTGAFSNCDSLTDITIPDSVTLILYDAFHGCSNLKEIVIPEGVTSTNSGTFTACVNLKSVTLPQSLTKIGTETFMSCYSLTDITIPEGVTEIGSYAFFHCEALTDIIIPENVTRIQESAFSNCVSLKSVQLPKGITKIEDGTFDNCSNLVIFCYKGSYAEQYAIAHEIPVKYIRDKADTDIFVFKTENKNAYYINENMALPIDVPCQYYNTKTYVPFRAIAAAVGINDLKFDSATGVITFTGAEGYTVKMAVGSSKCEITAPDGNKMSFTISAPVNIGGSTCLPVRDVSILTGGSVKFDDSGYVVVSPAEIDDSKIAEYISAYKNNVK